MLYMQGHLRKRFENKSGPDWAGGGGWVGGRKGRGRVVKGQPHDTLEKLVWKKCHRQSSGTTWKRAEGRRGEIAKGAPNIAKKCPPNVPEC